MTDARHPRLLAVYVAALTAAGAVLTVTAVRTHPQMFTDPRFWVLVGLVVAFEIAAVRMPCAETATQASVSAAFGMATHLVVGTSGAFLAAFAGGLAHGLVGRKPWYKIVFNIGQLQVSVLGASLVMAPATGNPLFGGPGWHSVADSLVGTAIGDAGFFVTNFALVEAVLRLHDGWPRPDVAGDWKRQVKVMGVILSTSPVIGLVVEHSLTLTAILAVPVVALYRGAFAYLQVEYAALHDGLTGLPNRALFHDRLEQAISWLERSGNEADRLVVLLADLDRFKEVNDTLGHSAGDRLLVEVSARLTRCLRASDTVARLGGDEFAIILRGVCDPHEAALVAQKIGDCLIDRIRMESVELEVSTSIGIAIHPDHGTDGEQLLKAADVAMYAAKRARSGYEIYSPDADFNTPIRLGLMAELRDAIDDGQITTVYQPLVRLEDGVCDLVEALVRWEHPGRGRVGPDQFVPLAEVTGLINPLTPYVLDLAVAQLADWDRRQVGVTVSVNISVQNLLGDRLLLEMYQLLDRYRVDPERLCLEITESMIMVDPVKSIETLKALSGMGLRLAVDDFGTGASSLAYLRTLPVDEVKLDRSFLSEIVSDHFERTLVKGIVDLGHSLGLTVVAEGVEDSDQMELLRDLGCDYGQGYLFGPPVGGDRFVVWHRGWNAGALRGR